MGRSESLRVLPRATARGTVRKNRVFKGVIWGGNNNRLRSHNNKRGVCVDYEFDYWHYIYVSGEYYPSISVQLIADYRTDEQENRKDSNED